MNKVGLTQNNINVNSTLKFIIFFSNFAYFREISFLRASVTICYVLQVKSKQIKSKFKFVPSIEHLRAKWNENDNMAHVQIVIRISG